MLSERIVVSRDWDREKGLIAKGHRGTCRGYDNVLCLACQNASSFILKKIYKYIYIYNSYIYI